MADAVEAAQLILGGGGGAIALWKAAEWLVVNRLKRAEKAEEVAESEDRAKLDTVLNVVTKMERELALMAQQLSTQSGTVSEVKGRIDGMSANYGARLAQLEKDVVELRTLVGGRRRR